MPATSPSAVTKHVSVPVGGPPLLGADGSTVSEAALVMFFIAASVASAVVTLGLAPRMDALVLSTASLWRAAVALSSALSVATEAALSVATEAVRFLGGWGGEWCREVGFVCRDPPPPLPPLSHRKMYQRRRARSDERHEDG